MRMAALLLLVTLGGCDAIPRDTDGSSERIAREGVMKVAMLPGTPDAEPAAALLRAEARRLGARVEPVPLHGEHALRRLEQGEIDAVVGHLAKNSPWRRKVSLSKAVAADEPADAAEPALRIARRNGENALILAIDRAIERQGKR